jgi:hypothetical protein
VSRSDNALSAARSVQAELPGPFTPEHDREVSAYVDGRITAAELYRRTVARYKRLEDYRMPDEDGFPATWDEAVAAFEGAEPVEVARPPRRVMVVYQFRDGVYSATSPQIAGFGEASEDCARLREIVRLRLASFLDPAVEVAECGYPASLACGPALSRRRRPRDRTATTRSRRDHRSPIRASRKRSTATSASGAPAL